ncbi:alpha/beta-Hydrolases superfamily protein [Prunus dulcis]|uniref:Alpha/beta-Hydrolases superfamily protein n=1 Tax=Prunus dulcis TaxID=3755 RepID=A0A4Y1QZA2_PRUDU|nr:alpha/beta-Hydrolases superfamily protein [Prunus dulcis]
MVVSPSLPSSVTDSWNMWEIIPDWTLSRRMACTPPPKGVSGVIDQTRGLLDYVDKNCSKAVYTPEVKYVCIAGRCEILVVFSILSSVILLTCIKRYLQGARLFGNSNESIDSALPIASVEPSSEVAVINDMSTSTSTTTTLRARFVGQGYKQADVWGDGVVPEVSAHLEVHSILA